LEVDPAIINTVIRNLVSNAIKFTGNGGKVELGAAEEMMPDGKGGMTIQISDTGVGMNSDRIEQLFDLNTNQSSDGTGGEYGTGLGLLLCKEFVGLHGGTIDATSEPGVGSVFSFTLPTHGSIAPNN